MGLTGHVFFILVFWQFKEADKEERVKRLSARTPYERKEERQGGRERAWGWTSALKRNQAETRNPTK